MASKIHIGKIIRNKITDRGMTVSEVARRLNKTPQALHQMFGRPSIDTETLLEIGDVLEYNFFNLFADKENAAETTKLQKNRRRIALTIDIDDTEQQRAVLKLLGIKLEK